MTPRKEDVVSRKIFSSGQITDHFRQLFYSDGHFKCTETQLTEVLSRIPDGLQFSLIGANELTNLPVQCPSCGAQTSLKDTDVQELLGKPETEKDGLLKTIVQVLTPSLCGYCTKPLAHLEIVGQDTTEADIKPQLVVRPDVIPLPGGYQFPDFGESAVSVGYRNKQDSVYGNSCSIGSTSEINFLGMSNRAEISYAALIRHLVSPNVAIEEPYTLGLVIASSFIAKADTTNNRRSSIELLLIAPGDGPIKIQNCDIGVVLIAGHRKGVLTFGSYTTVQRSFSSANIEPNTGSFVSMPQEKLIDANEMARLFQTGVIQGNIPLFIEQLYQFANYRHVLRTSK